MAAEYKPFTSEEMAAFEELLRQGWRLEAALGAEYPDRHRRLFAMAASAFELARRVSHLEAAFRGAERRADEWVQRCTEALRERDEARDCGQEGVCAIAPGCQRHWAERNTELVLERDRWKAMSETYVAGVGANVIRERDEARAAVEAKSALIRDAASAWLQQKRWMRAEPFSRHPRAAEALDRLLTDIGWSDP